MATSNGSTAIRDKILASLARYRALRIGKFPCAFWRLSSRPGLTAFAFAADKNQINWKVIVDVVSERTTGGIKRFEGKVCLTPNIIERAAEAEKLRRALITETGVDTSKDL
ncbi:hypothetical protein BMR05_06585 [Methylococcaceae bacterium HT4]|nr:hypothetical protein BMR05_06585 [Methylococcaceae bacterium HT4]